MVDYLKDLRPAYMDMIPVFTRRFYELHPDGSEDTCRRYIQSQILRNARRLVDYQRLALLAAEYPVDIPKVLSVHKSWNERSTESHVFKQLHPFLCEAKTIMDVGCGVTPVWLLDAYPQIEHCLCIEPDKRLAAIVERLCERIYDRRVVIVASGVVSARRLLSGDKCFDMVFIQKLIPMLRRRHDRRSLNVLSRLRFRYMLVTGSKHSLSRTTSIEDAERRSLLEFIRQSQFCIVQTVDDKNEFGYLLRRRS